MKKEEAIKYGKEWLKDEYLDAKDGAFIKIALEALEQEPKTGHWIGVNPMVDTLICSECGENIISEEFKSNYCPNCGAKMVEPQESETWNGIHAQITAPKGTFERIFNDADDDNDI